ncbi:hypothetical protein E4U43_002547 [Claviceps pusilla]|uniref:Nuclear pore complex protein Nup85 n=1 Tax=Claviceps pusilla TaxID=123648 RepID=A0A9P7SXF8_9HYPO|nr:hypothetical protein E4U43_002547 [Claviceps pusilla]
MAYRFMVPDSSPAPSTPDKNSNDGMTYSFLDDHPTTTPAGPPPASEASTTPAGAPSESYYGSSIIRGANTGSKPFGFGAGQSQNSSSGRNLFGPTESSNAPLGQSIRGRGRQPSSLSRQFNISSDDEEAEQDGKAEEEMELPPHSLFRKSSARPSRVEEEDEDAEGEDIEAKIDRYIAEEIEADEDAEADEQQQEESNSDGRMSEEKESEEESDEGDLFLNMRHDDRPYGQPIIGEGGEDLIMLNTPAATARVRREAEDIFRRSTAQMGGFARNRQDSFAAIAKDIYTQQDAARITEPRDLILKTEDLVFRLYQEGIGPEDDAEKMDNSLANITYQLIHLWNNYVEELPQPEGEDFATIGPGNDAEPFEKAAYVAQLILRIHHNRFENDAEDDKTTPLPEVLFDWQQTSHNLYPDQVREISRFKPSPACHSLYWQTLRNALLRGDVRGASQLLRNAGWENVSKGARLDRAYTGKALENVRRFADATCDVLDKCPAVQGDWDIWNSSWTLFRVQARGSLDKLALFAEGRDLSSLDGLASPKPQSMSIMARKASSQLPWDVYENLQMVYGIILGRHEAILETAQDWCEATVGLFGWWDDVSQRYKNPTLSGSRGFRASGGPHQFRGSSEYLDRLGSAFRLVLQSDMSPNPMSAVEVAIASCFEGNVNGVIGLLRTWSLPVASSVAEIASLGQWLPPTESRKPLPLDTLDMDDLALLGITPPTKDDIEGIKDTTLVLYARELAGIDNLSAQRDGWEIAIQVLGRMDVPQKSEEIVAELLRDLLATLDENAGTTVERMWRILNDLGMISYAEETAEHFADVLSKESHRYGEALWYYALAHRPNKVREVLNLLISYSLIQSTAFPSEQDLDEDLRDLLRKRTETLERRAKQDLDAAQLLGRMLSGYATLRSFYETRDAQKLEELSDSKAQRIRKQAATALVAVISSADDTIRGGLYDGGRDAVVSEDFLLALLGEATVFLNQSPCLFTLDQIDIVLKAVEDLQTVGSRVYDSCDTFLGLVLASGPGLKGSTPADLMQKSTASLSGSSYVLSGSSMLASHVQRSRLADGGKTTPRGWDWRRGWQASSKGENVLRRLRLGLSKDLARLWLEDADGVAALF